MDDLSQETNSRDLQSRLKFYLGKAIDQVPLLLADERIPITPKQTLSLRLNCAHEDDREWLKSRFIDTSAVYIAKEVSPFRTEAIIGLYSNPLVRELVNSLNPKTKLINGALQVDDDYYYEIMKDAFILESWEVSDGNSDHGITLDRRTELYEYLAEGDTRLVKDTLNLVRKSNRRRHYDLSLVSITRTEGLSLVRINSATNEGQSGIICNPKLDNNYSRLVGVPADPILYSALALKNPPNLIERVSTVWKQFL